MDRTNPLGPCETLLWTSDTKQNTSFIANPSLYNVGIARLDQTQDPPSPLSCLQKHPAEGALEES